MVRIRPRIRHLTIVRTRMVSAILAPREQSSPARITNQNRRMAFKPGSTVVTGAAEWRLTWRPFYGVSMEFGIGSPAIQYPSPTLTNSGELHMTFAIRLIGTFASISMPARVNRSRISDLVNG